MIVKTEYNIGDTVWVYGINRGNLKPAEGKVIKVLDLSDAGYESVHYLIEIPTSIDPLLEVRSWHNISQDQHGPVGALRSIGNIESTIKLASTLGFGFNDGGDADEEVSTDTIYAALNKSIDSTSHQPLVLKDTKPKARRRFPRKKSKE